MIEMRARKLVESKCDRFAFNFVTEALRAIRMCTDEHLLRRTVSLRQHQSLLEIYYCLLYKFKETVRLKTELDALDVQSAKEFILNSLATIDTFEAKQKRTQSQALNTATKKQKQSAAARLHKYHVLVSQYALQLILVRILNGGYGTDVLYDHFKDLLSEWIRRHKDRDNFDELFRKIIQSASSNSQIYDCCEILYEMVGVFLHSIQNKTFYIRTLNKIVINFM